MKYKEIIYLASILAGLSAVGCGQGTMDGEGSNSSFSVDVNSPGFKAFQSGLYSFASTQGCVKCHGNSVNPRFAVSDVVSAYRNARGKVGALALIDFNSPETSPFIVFSGNGHCNDIPCSNPATQPIMQGIIQAWAKAELTAPTPSGGGTPGPTPAAMAVYFTSTVAFPATIPSVMMANVAVIRFPLSLLRPVVASLNNAILEVEVQMINPTEYRVRNPKIVGNTAAVTLEGIHVYTRPASGMGIGIEDTAQGMAWVATAPVAPIVALPNPIPATPFKATSLETLSLSIMAQASSEVMTIGFSAVK